MNETRRAGEAVTVSGDGDTNQGLCLSCTLSAPATNLQPVLRSWWLTRRFGV